MNKDELLGMQNHESQKSSVEQRKSVIESMMLFIWTNLNCTARK